MNLVQSIGLCLVLSRFAPRDMKIWEAILAFIGMAAIIGGSLI